MDLVALHLRVHRGRATDTGTCNLHRVGLHAVIIWLYVCHRRYSAISFNFTSITSTGSSSFSLYFESSAIRLFHMLFFWVVSFGLSCLFISTHGKAILSHEGASVLSKVARDDREELTLLLLQLG